MQRNRAFPATCRILACCFFGGAAVFLPQTLQAKTALEIQENSKPQNIAVVIGIQAYDHIPELSNTRHDAESIAEMLRGFGYSVFDGYDLDKQGMEQLLRAAALNIRDQDQLFFYYAGHGVQLGRRNYLLTREAALRDIHDLPFQAVTLDQVSAILGGKAAQQILMLDSCRENPVPNAKVTAEIGAELYEARQGFDVFRPPLNTLVAFSTSPGDTALDGEPGANSPYTAAVLREFPLRPEDDAMSVLSEIRREVFSSTQQQQLPWESSTLTAKAYVRQTKAAAAPEMAPSEPVSAVPSVAEYPDTVTITASLGRALELAPQVQEFLPTDASASVLVEPSNGVSSLSVNNDTGALSLLYRPILVDQSASASSTLTDSFTLRLAQADTQHDLTVDLKLTPSECDLMAGDLLDLQGVGLHRFPNEIDLKAAERACNDAIQSQPGIGRFHYQLGRALQGQGRLNEAFQAFENALEIGHIRANNALAYLHIAPHVDRDVVNIDLDEPRAISLWEAGTAAGDPFSMHALGKRLLQSKDDGEKRRGFDLLSRALELGHTYSMNELGVYYLWSKSDAQPERGLSYLKASAERGDIYGIANLAYVHRDGLAGRAQNAQRAFELFSQAADGGHPAAPAEIGRMIMKGSLPAFGPKEALHWYDMGLSRGDAWSGANGAWVALNRLDKTVSPADAIVRAAKALALPDTKAQTAAQKLISEQSRRDIDAATQSILNEVGGDIHVDGQFGPASKRTLTSLAEQIGMRSVRPPTDPIARLKLAAQIYFAFFPIRQDLF